MKKRKEKRLPPRWIKGSLTPPYHYLELDVCSFSGFIVGSEAYSTVALLNKVEESTSISRKTNHINVT